MNEGDLKMNKSLVKKECIWFSKKVCKKPEQDKCLDDCSLKELFFSKDVIIKKMKEEEKNVKDLKKKGLFKNRNKIKDKIMGIYVLSKTLKEHFDYNESHVVDPEIERTSNLFTKGFRKLSRK